MQEIITQKIHSIEKEFNIEILFACESGSRAWGFASPDSDFDIRFIYKHSIDWYLSIEDHKDSIERPIVDNLDLGGWELRKTLRLIRKSNPTIFEWIQSPTIYYEKPNFRNETFAFCKEYFNPLSTASHYLGILKKSIHEIVDNQIKIKKYFYILRPLLAAVWVLKNNEIPPMEFYKLLEIINDNDAILNIIDDLLLKKSQAIEGQFIELIPELQVFINNQIEFCTNSINELSKSNKNPDILNLYLRKSLGI
jgi:predicted nucleotidyltransferase